MRITLCLFTLCVLKMPITEDVHLPTYEELDVPEINISSPVLRASATFFGKYCDEQCKEFMLCRNEERDPRKCLNEGKAVTSCGLEFYRKVKKSCREDLERFAKCMQWTSHDLRFVYCRKEQAYFHDCMLEKLAMPKPPFGYFSQVRVHDSKRPKPPTQAPNFNDPTIGLPEDFPRETTKFGWRQFYDTV